MTATLTRPFQIETADVADILIVLRQHYTTWSAGLNKAQYVDFMQAQLCQPWSRNNFRYLVARKGDAIVSSCKLYTFDFQFKGRSHKIAGIGAVFTPDSARGNGFANQMLEQVIDLAESEGFDALLLYSDIDPVFYERLGFELLPDNDFHIWTDERQLQDRVMSEEQPPEPVRWQCSAVTEEQSGQMVRHYRRYLATRPYGMVRDEVYWRYKLNRSLYRCGRVPNFPVLEMLTFELADVNAGYALFEQGGQVLRVLEVIGSHEARAGLWQQILRTAILRGICLVRGWEGTAPDFSRHLRYTERSNWARPMLLPLSQETDSWLDLEACPLLELDHF